MKTEEKLLKIVQRLDAKTQAGEIRWEQTGRSNVFQTAFPSYVVKLTSTRNREGFDDEDIIVSIVDESGLILESASDVDIKKAFPAVEAYATMKRLYDLARREALGVDAALDSLLGELD
jgi:hypothetical protein